MIYERLYRQGDEVILKDVVTGTSMPGYEGTTQVIFCLYGTFFTISNDSLSFNYKDIKCLKRNTRQKEYEEAVKNLKEGWSNKYKDLIYKREDVTAIANSIFGEERVDSVEHGSFEYDIIIHFPEFVISNREGRFRTIKDLYIKLNVRMNDMDGSSYKVNLDMDGVRTTFTLSEVNSNYSHSHLCTANIGSWQNFCLGSDFMATLIQNVEMDLTEENWYLLFFSMMNYLKWESIDSTPYIKMQSIKYGRALGEGPVKKELGRIIEDTPKEIWGYTDRLELVPNHPSIMEFFDKESKIRKLSTKTEKSVGVDTKLQMDKLKVHSISFKGVKLPYVIENDVSTIDSHITIPVVEEYCRIINDELSTFSKKLEYETRKQAATKS